MRRIIASAISAALLVGGAATASVITQSGAIAQTPSPSTEAPADGARFACHRGAPLKALVDDGVITQAQADAIHAKMKEQRKALRGEGTPRRMHRPGAKLTMLAQVLPGLVKDGTITQAQSDAITKWFADHRKQRGELRRAPSPALFESQDTIAV